MTNAILLLISDSVARVVIREALEHGAFLMVGGLIDDDRLEYRMELEGFEIFPKPYTATALLSKVKDVLSHN